MKTILAIAALAAALVTPVRNQSLDWGDCPGGGGKIGMQCAPLTVPLDWSNPNGRKVTLMLGRLKADDPDAGTVLVNFGGPGAAGISFMRDYETTIDPFPFEKLRHKMNVVTWDPRGYPGLSKPSLDLSCLSKVPVELRRTPPLPRDAKEFRQAQANSRTVADACRAQDPDILDHMDSASNVHDMEAIRTALGAGQLNLYMGSYGSVYGQVYAQKFPNRVRTMVLDGPLDHSADYWRSTEAATADILPAWQRFTGWCGKTATCAMHGQDIAGQWQRAVRDADRKPLPGPNGSHFDGSTLQELASDAVKFAAGPADWTRLATAIQRTTAGDPSGFVVDPAHPYPNGYPTSECRDWPRPDYARYASERARLNRIDPNFAGAAQLTWQVYCSGWPVGVSAPPAPLPAGLAPLLGVGSWSDYAVAARIVGRVPGSSTVRYDGAGHELYATGNTCVIAHVDSYLTTGHLPPRGTTC
ncbi:alpha/beta hydrolase [Fodinicola acaciae]|uniref:alpha/beta hydrolase n=1 Tax=Fodinicola acaciae TaxID=2681555 RepID=UPI0013D4363D|nr:alpha/beta hydrolase [Fodinicola acaciae]